MAVRNKDQASHALKGGLVAGLIAGLTLSLVMTALHALAGRDVWSGMKAAGIPFLGERALPPGFDAVAVLAGIASHFAVSAAWGALFGLLFFGFGAGATLLAAPLWGIVAWLGMFYVLLPLLGFGGFPARIPLGVAIFQHLLFGLAVGAAFLPYQRELPPFSDPRLTRRA